jgi:acyl-CoA-binding protein
MELNTQFLSAVAQSKTLSQKPANNVLLKLYSLYKQATEGDVNAEAPLNAFDFVAKAKYSAWEELKGMPKETAMQEYIDLVAELKRA